MYRSCQSQRGSVRIVLLLVLGLFGAGIYWWLSQGQQPKNVPADSELKRKAIAYLISKPQVERDSGELAPWEVFFANSILGKTQGSVPEESWFQNNEPLVSDRINNGFRVNWVGLPGCLRKDVPSDDVAFFDPKLVDAEGFTCHSWWRIKVLFDETVTATRVVIEEVGTEALVFD